MSDPTPPAGAPRGQLVAVMSAKGGCGATLLSVNLAAAGGAGTCVLDLDFSKGDVAGFLDVWPDRSLKDALVDAARIDLPMLRGLATRHKSGIDVLPQPFDLSEVVQPRAPEVRRLLALVREGWSHVVADCGSRLDEATLSAAMDADQIVLVSVATVPALRDVRRVINLLERLGVPAQRIRLVLNRWTGRGELDFTEIEHQLEMPIAATLAQDHGAADRADIGGHLLQAVAPGSALVGDIQALWGLLQGEAMASAETTHLRWRLWPRRAREET